MKFKIFTHKREDWKSKNNGYWKLILNNNNNKKPHHAHLALEMSFFVMNEQQVIST